MGNPSTPAPLEDVAVEYIVEALKSVGMYRETSAAQAAASRNFYRGIYRGLTHFFEDHLWQDYPNSPSGPRVTINSDGSPFETLDKSIINKDGAWLNE